MRGISLKDYKLHCFKVDYTFGQSKETVNISYLFNQSLKGLPCKTSVDYDDRLSFVQAESPKKHPVK